MTIEEFDKRLAKAVVHVSTAFPYQKTYKLSVKKEDDGTPLLQFYNQKFTRFGLAYWQTKIENGAILVNGIAQSNGYKIKSGEITERTEVIDSEPFVNFNIQLIYQDKHLIIINKPAPLPSQASGRFNIHSLQYILQLVFEKETIYPLHRLDANTTGVMVFAITKAATNLLNKEFKYQNINKKYLAIVDGLISKNQTITSGFSTEKKASGSREIGSEVVAKTHLAIKQYFSKNTMIEIEPETGRTNQIRLHVAAIGHPITGDFGYSNTQYFKENPMTYPSDCLYLHAWKIKFKHPFSQEILEFEAPIPEKFTLFEA